MKIYGWIRGDSEQTLNRHTVVDVGVSTKRTIEVETLARLRKETDDGRSHARTERSVSGEITKSFVAFSFVSPLFTLRLFPYWHISSSLSVFSMDCYIRSSIIKFPICKTDGSVLCLILIFTVRLPRSGCVTEPIPTIWPSLKDNK